MPDAFRLEVGGAVERPLSLSLDDLRERERVALPVTFECAGNGRALLAPAPAQPALADRGSRHRGVGRHAAGAAARRGRRAARTPSRRCSPGSTAGVEGGVAQAYERCAGACADAEHALLAYEMNGAPLPPQHGLPAAARGAGLVRHDERQVARPHHAARASPSRATRTPSATACTTPTASPASPVTRMLPRSLMVPAGRARLHDPRAPRSQPGPVTAARAAPGRGYGPIERVELSDRRRRDASRTPSSTTPLGDAAWRGWRFDWDAPAGRARALLARDRRRRRRQPLEPRLEPEGLREQRGRAHPEWQAWRAP